MNSVAYFYHPALTAKGFCLGFEILPPLRRLGMIHMKAKVGLCPRYTFVNINFNNHSSNHAYLNLRYKGQAGGEIISR
jgi:hypothetical protein